MTDQNQWGGHSQGPDGPARPFVSSQEAKGLFGSLFDFSFRHFATPHIVRIVYIVAALLIGIFSLGALSSAISLMANRQAFLGLLLLLATPLIALIQLALARMTMEMYVAVCRSAEELTRIRQDGLPQR